MATYTNIGTISYARKSSIRAEERLHWYLGLRQAELEIETKLKPALEDTFLEIEILSNKIACAVDPLEKLKLERQKRRLELLIPGAISELRACEIECDRIISEHEQELQLDKDALEELVAKDAYLDRCSRVIAGATLRSLGYSDSESQLLLELPPEDQLEVMAKVQMANGHAVAALTNAMSRVSPMQAQRIVELVEQEVTGILTGNLTGE